MSEKLDQLAHELGNEVQRLLAEKRALETKCEALRLTIAELEDRIGDHMKNLEIKQQLEKLQAKALKWVASLDAAGI